MSKDLSNARIFVSVFATKEKQQTIDMLEDKNKEIRYKLGQRIKHQLRVVPEIMFVLDDTLDYIENIENLLKN